MIVPRLEWLLPEPVPEPPAFAGFGRPVATLLARRGFVDDDGLRRFLQAGAGAAPRPVAHGRCGSSPSTGSTRAIAAGERIAIWGDYDADGMTAIVVWVLALRRLGVEPVRYVPSRLAEGYGLSAAASSSWRPSGVRARDHLRLRREERGRGRGGARASGWTSSITDHHLPSGDAAARGRGGRSRIAPTAPIPIPT